MSTLQQEIRKGEIIEKYLPAKLHEYSPTNWQIEYYVQSPLDGKMHRKRIRCNKILKHYKRKTDARKHIDSIIATINSKLFSGWSPLFEGGDARLYVRLSEVVEKYLKEKRRELRPATLSLYANTCKILLRWLEGINGGLQCSLFNRSFAVRFLDYVYNERGVSARTYNNYIRRFHALFEWAKEKGHTKENPFDQMKPKRKEEKKRIMIDAETRKRITEYLDGSPMLLVCMLVFQSLIRPKEIRNIRVGDIDTTNHVIKISGEVAKNHKTRQASISIQTENLIFALGILDHPKTDFVFSHHKTLAPGVSMLCEHTFQYEFRKLRDALGLPKEMQLYSLRDTGIFEMLKAGVDDLSVMQHADHSSLNITTIYANHHDPQLTERIREKAPDF